MAKRRRRKLKKQPKRLLVLLGLFAFFFILFRIGLSFQYLDNDHLPQNSQNLRAFALGIDVSEWQENIDWEKVKAAGYDFAIIRTSFGIDGQEDALFREHVQNAKAAGLDVGAYHYSHATTIDEALQEAEVFIELLNEYQWEYPVYYDIETDRQDHLSQKTLTELSCAFLERVSEAGYEVGIYAAEYWLNHRLDKDALQDYEVWIASYTDHLNYSGSYEIWQYCEDGQVDGIEGNVDINIAYYNYPKHIKGSRKNNY